MDVANGVMQAINLTDLEIHEVHSYWLRTDPSRVFQNDLDILMLELP